MKILEVIPYMLTGGAQTFIKDLIEADNEHDHEILTVLPVPNAEILPNSKNQGPVPIFNAPLIPDILEKIRPDVINYHWWPEMPSMIPGSKLSFGPQVFIFVHDNNTVPRVAGAQYIFMSTEAKRAQEHIADSRIINPLIDTSEYLSIKRPSDANGRFVIGRISSSSPVKFPDDLIELILSFKIPEAQILMMDGSRYFSEHRLRDPLLFRMNEIPVREALSMMDVFFYKTRDDWTETWCRVVTEAMASGLAIVAEKKGGIKDQIKHGETGFLCENNSDFKKYIELLHKDPILRAEIGRKARDFARDNFDIKKALEQYNALLTRP